VVWAHPTDSPVRPYHRKSAAWSEYKDEEGDHENEEFKRFGGSLYADKKKIKTNSNMNSINFSRNRAKVTNMEEYQNHRVTTTTTSPLPTASPTTPTSTSTMAAAHSRPFNEHIRNKMTLREGGGRRRAGRRSNHRRTKFRNSGLTRSGRRQEMTGQLAIHLQGEKDTVGGESRVQQSDGIFRSWTLARWARRMHLGARFGLEDGRLNIPLSGVYYIYAQVNYLDEHDVNAFQIYVNKEPFVMCTTMTHTPQYTTKANTCYTGGVMFLEKGDAVYVRNLEDNRYSVMLPAHSFFGLIQLSSAGG